MKIGYGKAIDWWTLGNILYEMMVGIPPFYTNNRTELFEKIKFVHPRYPSFLSATAKNLIESLLKKDPTKRLGSQKGAAEIKEHPFFKNINWTWMEEQKYDPFFIPKVNKNYGLHNFDAEFTELPIESLGISSDRTGPYKQFEGFTFNLDAKKVEDKADSLDSQNSTGMILEKLTDNNEFIEE